MGTQTSAFCIPSMTWPPARIGLCTSLESGEEAVGLKINTRRFSLYYNDLCCHEGYHFAISYHTYM